MIPVLKDKGSVHTKTEGKGCNHLDYVYPAWVNTYGCKNKHFLGYVYPAQNYWG